MADRDLRKLRRAELIEIIFALQKDNNALAERNKKLQGLLDKNQLGSYSVFNMDNQQGQYCRGQGTLLNTL